MNYYFFLQILSLVFFFTLTVIFFELKNAVDFSLGFLTLFIPNAIFALKLFIVNKSFINAETKLLFFYIGELIKLILVLALMIIFSKLYHSLHWLTYLFGIFVSLKVVYLLPLFMQSEVQLQTSSCKK